MTLAQALLLGVIQGLSEFLPVSSTAHLWLAQSFMHLDIDGSAFDIVLHLGTALALVINFGRELLSMVREIGRWLMRRPAVDAEDRALIVPLIVGTIPAAVVGVLFLKWAEQFRTYRSIGVTMIVAAIVFALAERQRGEKRDPSIGAAFLIGVVQGLAGLFPGLSRSGSTISAGMFTHLRRECAARFSFLLALPIILGAGAKTLLDARHDAVALPPATMLVAGFLAAAISGTIVVRFLLIYLAKHTLHPFAAYLFALGAVLVTLASTGVLHH
jgi:undecaprenyl-diphosphatase